MRASSAISMAFLWLGLTACTGSIEAGAGAADADTAVDAEDPGGTDAATSADAGSGADGAPGDPADAAPGAPGCSGAAVCEDFEATPPGAQPPTGWSVVTPSCSGTGSVAVTTAQAHSGTHALEVDGAGGFCNHVFVASNAPATLGGALHLRFYVRLDDAIGDGHVSFAALHDASDGKDLRMGGQSRILMWNRELDDATLPALSPTGIAMSLPPAPDVWHCVQVDVDGAAGTLRTQVDGALVAGLVIDATPTPDVDQQWLQAGAWHPQLTDLKLGWESYAGQAMRLWFDDVAIGAAPISCE